MIFYKPNALPFSKILILAFILIWPSKVIAACDHPLSVAVPNFPPYANVDRVQNYSGMDIELIQNVMNSAGCDYTLFSMPWKRAIIELKQNKIDFIPMMSWKEERTKFGRYSILYRWEVQKLAVLDTLPNKTRYTNLKSFLEDEYTIGGLAGVYHGSEFQELVTNGPWNYLMNELTNPNQNVSHLLLKRVDALIMDSNVFMSQAEKAGHSEKFHLLDFDVYKNRVHFLFSLRNSSEFVQFINHAIFQVLSDPEYSRIYSSLNRLDPKKIKLTGAHLSPAL